MLSQKETQEFITFMKNDQLVQAFVLAKQLNQKYPDNEITYNMLGEAFLKKNDLSNAILCYRSSLSIAPKQINTLLLLGKIYDINGDQPSLLFDVYSKALTLEPKNTTVLCRVGAFLSTQGQFNDAQALLNQALALGDKTAHSYNLGLLERQGDKKAVKDLLEDQYEYFQQKIKTDGEFETIRAIYFTKDYLKVLEVLTSLNTDERSFSWLSMYHKILGDTYEKLNNHHDAFLAYQKMNQSIPAHYQPDYFVQLSTTCLQLPKKLPLNETYTPKVEPIFIVGMPRTGTSLIEKIINTESQVCSGGELYLIDELFLKFNENQEDFEPFIKNYHTQIQSILDKSAHSNAGFITDKMPTNFFFIGMIKKLFPSAKIIYLQRNAVDTGMSIFKQNFTAQIPYSTDFKNIAHFLSLERQLMKHWLKTYPDILSINFERFLQNFKPESQRLFQYLGFEWSEQLSEFYKINSFTRTASNDQIKQAINPAIIEQYKPYTPYLDGFKQHLKRYNVEF